MIVRWIARAIIMLVPAERRDWAAAMTSEIWAIEGKWQRLAFALSCLLAAFNLNYAAEERDESHPANDQSLVGHLLRSLACAAAAMLVGLAYLYSAGAPPILMASNVAAFCAGILLLIGLYNLEGTLLSRYTALAVTGALATVFTAICSSPVEGAARWISVGGVFMQTSLALMPLAVVAFSRSSNIVSATAMSAMAIGLALQPDRAMAGALLVGLVTVASIRRGWTTVIPALISAAAFIMTLVRPDALPAVPYVDLILWSGFVIHPLLGLSMWAGCGALLYAVCFAKQADKAAKLTFLMLWTAIIGAAVIGAYPTPFVGYGAAAIIGYLLSLFGLYPPKHRKRRGVKAECINTNSDDPSAWFRAVHQL